MEQLAFSIERLLQFSLAHGLIGQMDVYVARNALLDIFKISEPYTGEVCAEKPDTPTDILEALLDGAAQKNLYDAEIPALRINFEARVMGTVMPRESEVCTKFNALWQEKGVRAATDYFYALCITSNYIRTAQIAKNIGWNYASKYGRLEITINLTKPEKDPKTIALERLAPSSSYPSCMLCIENIGYAGRVNFPARQNHRVVPVSLCGEAWYLQYSPYVYYNEHCIVFQEKHAPMEITAHTFAQIFDFVRQFPHYTCGSNADLPIVGGSILSHMHFQGGNYEFPMQNAGILASYVHTKYPGVAIEILHWPVSTVRLRGQETAQLLAFSQEVLQSWREYSDESADVLAYTQEGGTRVPHNTITPILHYNAACSEYVFDLVPRNNRTTAEFPEGIFHPHREIHHIKKENIGLIEVMGLAILPSRLQEQSLLIANVLMHKMPADAAKKEAPEHADWIDYLLKKYPLALSENDAVQTINAEIGAKFETCLEHAGVYKQTPAGLKAFELFLLQLGCERL